jgi:hypothetical protein
MIECEKNVFVGTVEYLTLLVHELDHLTPETRTRFDELAGSFCHRP